jgi:hypothetical protein
MVGEKSFDSIISQQSPTPYKRTLALGKLANRLHCRRLAESLFSQTRTLFEHVVP